MIDFLKDLIVSAGQICKQEQSRLTPEDVEFKSGKDLVTSIDKKVERFICQSIAKAYPSHDIFGEEFGQTSKGSDYLWIIDPIDGTTSFLHQQPFYSVSIALYHTNQPEIGAVYLPVFNELFYAQKDGGAFLNDHRIFVSRTEALIDSVMATGFACLRADLEPNNLVHFNRILPVIRDIRRYGSAASDLCYVACGRCDGFWEMNLNIYDIAAGALIVQEAGGVVTDFAGLHQYPENGIMAAPPQLQKQLQQLLAQGPGETAKESR